MVSANALINYHLNSYSLFSSWNHSQIDQFFKDKINWQRSGSRKQIFRKWPHSKNGRFPEYGDQARHTASIRSHAFVSYLYIGLLRLSNHCQQHFKAFHSHNCVGDVGRHYDGAALFERVFFTRN